MPSSYEQGYNALAKCSTRLLAQGASVTACTTDLSQYATNLTAGTNVVYELTTSRFNRGAPRTILFRGTCTNANTGTLYQHGTSSSLERFELSAANTIRLTVNNTVVGTFTATVLRASADTVVLAWIVEANPDTTGASNAVLSKVVVYNVTTGSFEIFRATHAAKTLQASTTCFFGAQSTTGTAAFAGTITSILYENRAMSPTEIDADWVTTYTPPSSVYTVDLQGIPPTSLTIDNPNHWHGPAAVWVAEATRRMQRRTLSAFVNDRCRIRPSWQTTTLDGPFVRRASGDLNWRMPLGHLRVVPVPDTCNAIAARVHARCWTTSGAAVPTGIRVYSFSRPPAIGGGGLHGVLGLEKFFDEVVVTRDDDASNGAWSYFDPIPIARGKTGIRRGKTYIAIALAIDPYSASTNDANARVAVNAVEVVPGFLDPAGGGQFGVVLP